MIRTKPNRCTECSKLICQKNKSGLCGGCYRQSPKMRAYHKIYRERPEIRERRRLRYIKIKENREAKKN